MSKDALAYFVQAAYKVEESGHSLIFPFTCVFLRKNTHLDIKTQPQHISVFYFYMTDTGTVQMHCSRRPHPIDGDPGHMSMCRFERLCFHCILMHQTVTNFSSGTWLYGLPFNKWCIELQTLEKKKNKKKSPL